MKLNRLWETYPDYQKLLNALVNENNRKIYLKGLQGSSISFLISSMVLKKETGSCLLFLSRDNQEMIHFFQDVISFTGLQENKNIFIFPSFEVLPYEDIARDNHIVEQRLKVLSMLAANQDNDLQDKKKKKAYPMVIVTNYKAILPRIMNYQDFSEQYCQLKKQGILQKETFLNYLVCQGYQYSGMVEYPGQFSQRGGMIDLFPFTEENPIRIELDSDHIESLRFFQVESQRSIEKVDEILLLPQRELFDSTNGKKMKTSSFFDYLPSKTTVMIQESLELEKTIKAFEQETFQLYQEKKQNNVDKLTLPEEGYLTWEQVVRLVDQHCPVLYFDGIVDQENFRDDQDIKSIAEYNIETNSIQSYYGKLDLFFEDIKKWQYEKKNLLLVATNRGRALRLAEIFHDRGFYNDQIMALTEADVNPGNVCLSYGQVNYGFTIPSLQLIVITDQEIFGRERDKGYRTKRYQGKPFYQIEELNIGDYLVHVQHGIGRYAGIRSKEREGVHKDYLLIQYAEDDELYVPIDQLHLVHKYIGIGGQPPKLYRLGGTSWNRVKRKVKESIQKMAWELFELYRKRKNIKGFPFSRDSIWQQELEMAFPFEETPDQQKALVDVKKDMESYQPMERLICGDVGYGKTEIAIRAAFKAVMDGKQVAVLAPTTILAQQHWENFTDRMKPFPVRVEMLSRFKLKKEQNEIITDLKKGSIDIIIGTHRLVQKDIIFNNLGLLVVDEEQRFGVEHKERVKKLKEQVDSLTLTATPIPRTLYFSLIGVREMSLINTPPELRLPIATYLREKTDQLIQEAVRREIERGGQIYYVHNRVQDIELVAERLMRVVPEAKIVVAHGQMPEIELENIMVDFLNRRYDLLVCTTIIEIGLDIPNVNTIIIDEAHQFGLAQLYQLRGRVGRSERKAYAYLLYSSKEMLSENAKKRLQAIKEFSDLGSGFRLAMRDLEIRGAGNLLGKEQHGFVSEIGFNYYCQLLEDSIDELKEIESGKSTESKKDPEIEVLLDSYIPDRYISDLGKRVAYYQKLSQVNTIQDIDDIRDELEDIYGSIPREVQNLLAIIHLKSRLKQQGVTNIRLTPRYFSFRYEVGAPMEKKLKKFIVMNHQSIVHHRKGSHFELKLLLTEKKENVHSDRILKKIFSFLDEALADDIH